MILLENETDDRITKVSKSSPQNNSETVTNEEQILKEGYISAEQRQKVIDDLRLI